MWVKMTATADPNCSEWAFCSMPRVGNRAFRYLRGLRHKDDSLSHDEKFTANYDNNGSVVSESISVRWSDLFSCGGLEHEPDFK